MAFYCIGDIHGKFNELAHVLRQLPVQAHVVCVGDIGLGFIDSELPSCLSEVDDVATSREQKVWLVRGNHDNPEIWFSHRSSWNKALQSVRIPPDIHRMRIENIHVMMVGGATSLDRSHQDRLEGENWWSKEPVSKSAPKQIQMMVESYGRADILITHAGPLEAQPAISRDKSSFDYYSSVDPSLSSEVKAERKLLSDVVVASMARTCAFGHYHVSLESNVGKIRYRCCAELEAWQYEKRNILPPLPNVS
jgi:predicted phosphodiesterase